MYCSSYENLYYASHKCVALVWTLNKWSINIADCCPAALSTTQQMVYNSALWYSLDQIQSSHAIPSMHVHSHTHTMTKISTHSISLSHTNTHTFHTSRFKWVQLCPLANDGSLWDAAKLFHSDHRMSWVVSAETYGPCLLVLACSDQTQLFTAMNGMLSGLWGCLHYVLKIGIRLTLKNYYN